MLILHRRIHERIALFKEGSDEKIWIEITDVTRDGARIGITAPKEITILREEMLGREKCLTQSK